MSDKDAQDKDEPKPISFLGLSIHRKTDILAATAFFLAVAGTLFQVFNYFRGPRPSMFPPEFVTVFFDTYPNGDTIVRFAAAISYANSGDATYGAVLKREWIDYSLHSIKYEQVWQSFQAIERNGTSIVFRSESNAKPTPIPGASAISHTTVFAPRPVVCRSSEANCQPYRNYVTRSEFLGSLSGTESVSITFHAQLVGSSAEFMATCSVGLDAGVIALLVMNNWYYAQCSEGSGR